MKKNRGKGDEVSPAETSPTSPIYSVKTLEKLNVMAIINL